MRVAASGLQCLRPEGLARARRAPHAGDMGIRIATLNVWALPGPFADQVTRRMRAISTCDVFEVSTPHLDDVVRMEDRYGRAPEGREDG